MTTGSSRRCGSSTAAKVTPFPARLMVVDPITKNVYYTEEVKESKSGAVKFIDAKTGKDVTLQKSEVKEVTKDEFKAGVGKK